MSRTGPRRAARVLALFLSITVVGLGGTAGHSWATVPPETAPPVTAPPETSPPAAAPDTVPAGVPAEEDDDGIDVGTWLLVTLVVVLAIIVISAVIGGIGRRSGGRTKTRAAAPAPPAPATDTAHQLLASAQWVHDQLSLELMAAAPAQARQRWSVERSRIDNIVIGTQAEASRLNSASWLQLGQFLSELASAIETNLQLRMQDPPNLGMIQESANVITARRNDIQAAINLLRPTLR
ncbi:MAG TPA: hypothetical protein VFQ15_07140 [Jiangellaceae bacterium]|nr:hypothetical protein [Jiangellaceae bacterium]